MQVISISWRLDIMCTPAVFAVKEGLRIFIEILQVPQMLDLVWGKLWLESEMRVQGLNSRGMQHIDLSNIFSLAGTIIFNQSFQGASIPFSIQRIISIRFS